MRILIVRKARQLLFLVLPLLGCLWFGVIVMQYRLPGHSVDFGWKMSSKYYQISRKVVLSRNKFLSLNQALMDLMP